MRVSGIPGVYGFAPMSWFLDALGDAVVTPALDHRLMGGDGTI